MFPCKEMANITVTINYLHALPEQDKCSHYNDEENAQDMVKVFCFVDQMFFFLSQTQTIRNTLIKQLNQQQP